MLTWDDVNMSTRNRVQDAKHKAQSTTYPKVVGYWSQASSIYNYTHNNLCEYHTDPMKWRKWFLFFSLLDSFTINIQLRIENRRKKSDIMIWKCLQWPRIFSCLEFQTSEFFLFFAVWYVWSCSCTHFWSFISFLFVFKFYGCIWT